MSSEQRPEEHVITHDDSCMDLVYKKWALELADYLTKLQIEQEEKYVYALAEEVTERWEDIDHYSSGYYSSHEQSEFEEEEEEEDLEEKIRQYKIDLRCNMQ